MALVSVKTYSLLITTCSLVLPSIISSISKSRALNFLSGFLTRILPLIFMAHFITMVIIVFTLGILMLFSRVSIATSLTSCIMRVLIDARMAAEVCSSTTTRPPTLVRLASLSAGPATATPAAKPAPAAGRLQVPAHRWLL